MKPGRLDTREHVVGWGGAMHPYRRHAQGYHPAPARRTNWLRRLLRAVLGALS